jgi:hypothetical protein
MFLSPNYDQQIILDLFVKVIRTTRLSFILKGVANAIKTDKTTGYFKFHENIKYDFWDNLIYLINLSNIFGCSYQGWDAITHITEILSRCLLDISQSTASFSNFCALALRYPISL